VRFFASLCFCGFSADWSSPTTSFLIDKQPLADLSSWQNSEAGRRAKA
jgi:hypothetical protein